MKPRLLDLFCGAGGAAMGYHRAGFEVVGVDIRPQPNYPFRFIQGDALEYVRDVVGRHAWPFFPSDFDAIHASPPCQAHSTIAKQARKLGWTQREHPDLVAETRELLQATGIPYIIENVPGAPLEASFQLCGSSFGLNVRRHRLFEIHGFDVGLIPPCAHHWQRPRFPSADKRRGLKEVVPIHGTGQQLNLASSVLTVAGHLGKLPKERELREWAMQIDWMSPYELTQAIPPAYTEFIGHQLLAHLRFAA